ncbi:MAG: hypothetical protein ABW128_16930 [Rhizorhabdus sp.]
MAVPYIKSDTSVTVIINMMPKVIDDKNPCFKAVIDLLKDPNVTEDQLVRLVDIPTAVETFTGGDVYVKNGKLYYQGCEVRTSLGQKIMEFVRTGEPELAEPLKKFLANVQQNPDPRAAQDLFDWVQASGLPITGDGYLLAWKAVRDDYTSLHTPGDKRFDHRIGNRVEQPRDECDADPTRTCSSGLHFAGAAYLKAYLGGGARIVVVRIHPKDVVSFPTDYQLQKGRACGYDVVGEVPGNRVLDFYPQGAPVYRGFDKPAPAAPAPVEKVKFLGEAPVVGGVYRRRDGKAVVIVSEQSANVMVDQDGYGYDARSGSQFGDNRTAYPTDLIEKIKFPLNADDFEVGQQWVQRDGQTATIVSIQDGIITTDFGNLVWLSNGKLYNDRRTSPRDLVFRLNYAPLPPKAERRDGFAVGQVWETRNGQRVTIVEVLKDSTYWLRTSAGATYGNVYNGAAYYLPVGRGNAPVDLVKLITDVR